MMVSPVFKDLVLVGGGHSHALVLRQWAMDPLPGVRITLISPQVMTPYSGMLPGLIAGHYQYEQTHIDLVKLSLWANIRFIQEKVTGIDPEARVLHLENYPDIEFDVVSFDIGSTPDQHIDGASEFTTPVKPISEFYSRWQLIQQQARQKQIKSLAVVGGGAGSIEVILAKAFQLQSSGLSLDYHLVTAADRILPNYNQIVRHRVIKQLKQYRIIVHTSSRVDKVEQGIIYCQNNQSIHADEIIWCTQAAGSSWLRTCSRSLRAAASCARTERRNRNLHGVNEDFEHRPSTNGSGAVDLEQVLKQNSLECTDAGFIKVRQTLQALHHDHVFAAGDIAEMIKNPRPKAGVYAVRQAPVLFHNLKAILLDQPLKKYKPQDDFLSLLALGEKTAAGSKYFLGFYGDWAWHWKDRIDRQFMDKFHHLPELSMPEQTAVNPKLITDDEKTEQHDPAKRCAGCGGKIGASLLQQVLDEVLGNNAYDPKDAVQINQKSEIIFQSVDAIKSPFQDPWLFGRIAVNHALSDLYAMNLAPGSVQLLITLPYAGQTIQKRQLKLLIQGVVAQLERLQCLLLGGHTSEASELSIGIVANGTVKEPTFHKHGLKSGDKLVMSKPLGTGVVLAAAMQNQCDGKTYNAALESMLKANDRAARLLSKLNVKSCTDVTGFGLVGHLQELCIASSCAARVQLNNIPLLAGAEMLAERSIKSSLYSQNQKMIADLELNKNITSKAKFDLLFDPQTSGGLLAGIPAETYKKLDNSFHQSFFTIGEVCQSDELPVMIQII